MEIFLMPFAVALAVGLFVWVVWCWWESYAGREEELMDGFKPLSGRGANTDERYKKQCWGCGHTGWWHRSVPERLGVGPEKSEICDKCMQDRFGKMDKVCQKFQPEKPTTRRFRITEKVTENHVKIEFITIEPHSTGVGFAMFRDRKPMFASDCRFTTMQSALDTLDGVSRGLGKRGSVEEVDPPPFRGHMLASTTIGKVLHCLPPAPPAAQLALLKKDEAVPASAITVEKVPDGLVEAPLAPPTLLKPKPQQQMETEEEKEGVSV